MKRLAILSLMLLSITANAQYKIIAHRGASGVAPENTVASANKAWELGADAVEIDVHLSRDNKVMVIHDKNTRRTTGESYDIAETGSDTLRMLDAGSFKSPEYKGEKIPFLEEVIATIPEGKTLFVEIKSDRKIVPFIKEIVDNSDKKDQIVFIAFDLSTIVEAKTSMHNNKCYWLSAYHFQLKKGIVKAARAGLEGIDLRYGIINEKVMERAGNYKLEVLAWTVDKPKEAKKLTDLGVTGITTNKPDLMKKEL